MKLLERLFKKCAAFLLRLFFQKKASLPHPLSPGRILVIRQHNQLGDMICVVPLFTSLRAAFPDAQMMLMASPVNIEVMRHHHAIDGLIKYDKSLFRSHRLLKPGSIIRFLRDLRRREFDLVVVPMTVSFSFTSSLLAFASRATYRIGAGRIDGKENPGSAFFNLPVDLDWRTTPERHQTLRNCDTARELIDPPEDLSCRIDLTEEEREAGKRLVAEQGGGRRRAVAFHPGAGKIPNRWPADRFSEVAEALHRTMDASVWITEGPMDREAVVGMKQGLSFSALVVTDRTIRDVASILACMDLVISNDTGIMHVAAAVGTPVLSLFGPTDPHQWAPAGGLHRYLHAGDDIRGIRAADVIRNAQEMLA